MAPGPKRFRLNVGGTRYEVSDSLLDRFPDSMLRNITSDRWNNNNTMVVANSSSQDNETDDDMADSVSTDPETAETTREIFIERDGERFRLVLDYMRDGTVVLPWSVPRRALVADLEYYGIRFEEASIVPGDDLFASLSACLREKAKFDHLLVSKKEALETRYRAFAVEFVAHKIAATFFERLYLRQSDLLFEPMEMCLLLEEKLRFDSDNFYRLDEELQPRLMEYGLTGSALNFVNRAKLEITVQMLGR